jgi:hypothetical protein
MTSKTILFAALLTLVTLSGCKKDLVCPAGQSDCDGRCVALQDDEANCGACGVTCGLLHQCSDGACRCAEGLALCGQECADLNIDPAHCGSCGVSCGGATPFCDGATCVGACAAGEAECAGGCVDFQTHPLHCGACGHACQAGEVCSAGKCRPDAYVACYWTNEVKPVSLSLQSAGAPINLGTSRPASLDLAAGQLYVASGQPQASLSVVPVGGSSASTVPLPGFDLNTVLVHGDAVLVTNSAVGTLEILALDGTVLDEIPMPDQQSFPNPHGVVVVGTSAYVALNSMQKIVKLDLSPLAACTQPDPGAGPCGVNDACDAGRRCIQGTCKLECGSVTGTIDLTTTPGLVDGAAQPQPSAMATDGTRVFVTIANLEFGHVDCDGFSYDFFAVPAGPGRIAVLDTANADAISVVNLGAGCKSPSALELRGTKLWVSCGAYCFQNLAPGAVLAVDVTGTPAVGTPISTGSAVAGKLAFCGNGGYVTDQRKTGAVLRFDPSTGLVAEPVTICGADVNGNALAADVVCTE